MKQYMADLRDGARTLASREFWRDFRMFWYGDAPGGLSDGIDGWLMGQHEPTPGSFPVVCSNRNLIDHRGDVPWPCADWTEAAERRQARRVAR